MQFATGVGTQRGIAKPMKRFARRLWDFFNWDEYAQRCWSQEGEDMILRRLFGDKSDGFYVDVGAHHPRRFSNTHLLYCRGWSGINIEPMPGSIERFKTERPRDINIECGVGLARGTMTYYMFNEPALNGFSRDLSVARSEEQRKYKIIGTSDIRIMPLEELLEQALPDNQRINFLSVDVEGQDLDVLRSNNWNKFRPEYVLAEILNENMEALKCNPVVTFMWKQDYVLFAKCFNTVFFQRVS